MKFTPRHTGLALAVASLAALTAACNKPADTAEAKKDTAAAEAGKDGAKVIPGLATEKEQVSYMIGMDMARSLEPVKGEIDLDTLHKALKTSLEGGKPLLDEKQAAHFLGAAAGTLGNWRRASPPVGPAYAVIEGVIRYAPADLREYVNSKRRDPRAAAAA